MNKQEAKFVDAMFAETQVLRHLCDTLAQALVEGGVDRQWEALTMHEQIRGGVVDFPREPKAQPKRARKPRPSQGIQGFTYRDFKIEPNKDEDQQEDF
jgi:hypothetical protein